jgi:Flp pilus assembly protein TadG
VKFNRTPNGGRAHRQKGIAAIEFAFVFMVMLLVTYGVATFGAVLYIQQVVSRAAEDGARAVALLPSKLVANDPKIQGAVYDSLAAALVVPVASSGSLANRLAWIKTNAKVTVDVAGSDLRATVSVVYDYSANRLLPSLPMLDASLWMPNSVVGKATAIQASQGPST